MESHFGLLVLFAFFVSVVFALLTHDTPREQVVLGGKIFGAFLLAGVMFGWLLFPFPF